jgi:hypothetical protein
MAVHKHRKAPPTLPVLFHLYVALDGHYQRDLAASVMAVMSAMVS